MCNIIKTQLSRAEKTGEEKNFYLEKGKEKLFSYFGFLLEEKAFF